MTTDELIVSSRKERLSEREFLLSVKEGEEE
jgi:hypothetical protein